MKNKTRKDTQLIDQEGLGFLSQQFAKVGCTLNEQRREIGIDAILEVREDSYTGSGKFIAIQVKSGDSYLIHETDDAYIYYADETHAIYWQKCCLPVLLVIYSPHKNKAYWCKIGKTTLIKARSNYKIVLLKENTIPGISKKDLFELFFGRLYESERDFEIILNELDKLRYYELKDLFVSGLELYINGLIDFCSQLYFFTDLYSTIIDSKINAHRKELSGYSFPVKTDFFPEFFRILNFHNLLEGDFGYELESLKQRDILPIFIRPLTINGHRLNEFLRRKGYPIHDRLYINCGGLGVKYYISPP
jgi:hypothetical protein